MEIPSHISIQGLMQSMPLLTIRQGRAARTSEVMGNGMEDCERTHVFLFVWKSQAAELAVEIYEPLIKKADPGYSWEDIFVAAEELDIEAFSPAILVVWQWWTRFVFSTSCILW